MKTFNFIHKSAEDLTLQLLLQLPLMALGTYAADFDLPVTLTVNQWGYLENMNTLLALFKQLAREISSAQALCCRCHPSGGGTDTAA